MIEIHIIIDGINKLVLTPSQSTLHLALIMFLFLLLVSIQMHLDPHVVLSIQL